MNYQTQGTAQNGADYQHLSGSVTIPAGQVSAEIDIVPIDDESLSDESQGDVAGVQLTGRRSPAVRPSARSICSRC